MIEDENIEEVETSSEESTETNHEDESKETDKSKDVPYKRFSNVVKERNEAREALEAAEAKLNATKEVLEPKEVVKEVPKTDSLSREDAILYAKGKNDDQVAYAHKVAELEDITVTEALDNPLYQAWEAKQSVDTANSAAQLGASRSSAPHHVDTFAPGQSKVDHKALWEKSRQK